MEYLSVPGMLDTSTGLPIKQVSDVESVLISEELTTESHFYTNRSKHRYHIMFFISYESKADHKVHEM